MRLIDADALMDRLAEGLADGEVLYRIPPSAVDKAPTVDAVPVVRCWDCQFCCTGIMGPWCSLADGMLVISPDAFCSYGVQREGTDD